MFEEIHQMQYEYFKNSNEYTDDCVNKYVSQFALNGMLWCVDYKSD